MERISIVIPALNEEKAIESVIRAIPKYELEMMGYDVQVLVVDNGSSDKTGELAGKAGAEVIFEPNRGYGRAYKAGFAHAKGNIITTADADLTYPVEDIPKLVELLKNENLDFITTNRFTNMDIDAMRIRNRLGNSILNLVMRVLFGLTIRDSQSGMWLFRREILPQLVLKSDGMAFSEELKIEACYFNKCKWQEVGIRYRKRVGEVKLSSWRDGTRNLVYLVKKRISR
jgi:hypothetical protein